VSRTSKRLRARRGDEGFTLIEVMAAMIVFAIVATGVTAMFASGLRASVLTKMETTAKNLSQQRFEQIRNLPFHIDQVASGTNPPDLLDTYFANTTGSAGRGVQGYVPAGATRWTADGDPATGAFYRYVQTALPGYPKYKQYVATQFLDESGSPYTPTGFNALVSGSDTPPTLTVGVGVTTIWNSGELARTARAYTQITNGRPSAPTSVLQSRLTALRLTAGLADGQTLSMDLASLTADGGLSQTVSAAQAVRGAVLELSAGATANGAVTSVKAPPNEGPLGTSAGPKTLVENGVTWASVGSTSTSNVSATSSTGQVVLGASSGPAKADVLGSGGGGKVATFAMDADANARLGLLAQHAYVEDAGCGGSCSNVGVSGWAGTTKSGTNYTTTTSASAKVRGVLALLPTSYAPLGLVRVALTDSSVSCTVARSGGTPSASASITYTGSLSYYAPFDPAAVNGYRTVALSSSDIASPLSAELLAQTQVGTDGDGNPLWLSDYFSSWSSMDVGTVSSAATLGADGSTVAASFSGMIGVKTVPLRAGDDSSVIAADIATGACTAEDHR